VSVSDVHMKITADQVVSRVSTLAASLVSGAATRLDAVNSVENYLRTTETYNLNSPVPRSGESEVGSCGGREGKASREAARIY